MVALSTLTTNPDRVEQPIDILIETDDGPFTIVTRGFTAAYRAATHEARLEAVAKLNRGLALGARAYSVQTLPPDVDDRISGTMVAKYCIHDIQGLTHDDGAAVTVDEFRALIADPNRCGALLVYALMAARQAHSKREDKIEAASGN